LGNNLNSGAEGLKRLRNFERSKSAPAGFGVLEGKGVEKDKRIKISISRGN